MCARVHGVVVARDAVAAGALALAVVAPRAVRAALQHVQLICARTTHSRTQTLASITNCLLTQVHRMPCGLAVYCQLLSVASAQMLTRDAGLGVVHLRVPGVRDVDRAVDAAVKFHNRRVLSGEAASVGWVVLLSLSTRLLLGLLGRRSPRHSDGSPGEPLGRCSSGRRRTAPSC